MSDAERSIGRLEGKMDLALERITSVEQKVDALRVWKWKTAGVISAVATAWIAINQFLTP